MNRFCPSASLRALPAGKTGGATGLSKRIIIVAALILLFGGLNPIPARGADPGPREALLESLPQGGAFDNDGQRYVLLPTLRSAKETSGISVRAVQANQVPGESASGTGGEVLEKRGLFTIYKPASAPPASGAPVLKASSDEGKRSHPVVLNQRTKALGVLTRNLWLKLKEMGDSDGIAHEYGMILSFSNPAMKTSFYEVPEGLDLWTLRDRLRSDERIVRVTLEVIDRKYRPR